MAFKSLVEQARKRRAYTGPDDKITFSLRGRGTTKPHICLSLGPLLVEEAGFIKGDKLDLLWDPEDEIAILRRDNEKGKGFTKTKTGRAAFSITWSEGMPTPQDGKRTILSGIEVKNLEIIFDLPTHKDKPADE